MKKIFFKDLPVNTPNQRMSTRLDYGSIKPFIGVTPSQKTSKLDIKKGTIIFNYCMIIESKEIRKSPTYTKSPSFSTKRLKAVIITFYLYLYL
jgi:hypothetical protein